MNNYPYHQLSDCALSRLIDSHWKRIHRIQDQGYMTPNDADELKSLAEAIYRIKQEQLSRQLQGKLF